MRRGGVVHFEAAEQFVVAQAMALRVYGVVGDVILGGVRAYLDGAQVVRATAHVDGRLDAQIVVLLGYVTGAAPFGT